MKITHEGVWLGTFAGTVCFAATNVLEDGEPVDVTVEVEHGPNGPTTVHGSLTAVEDNDLLVEVSGAGVVRISIDTVWSFGLDA